MPVKLGYLRTPRVYYIDEFDCYFPGFFQTMLSPGPNVLWDDLDIKPSLDQFQRMLDERVRHETRQRGHMVLRPSLAHVRREVFNPSVVRLLDGAYPQ